MAHTMKGPSRRRLRWSLLAAAAITLLPAMPVHAGAIPDKPEEVRALIAKVAETGDLNTMSELIKAGMDINLQDINGQPALVTATLAKQDDMVLLLLGHKADVMTRTTKGMTALHAAAYVGDMEIVRMLVEHGADINDQANIAGVTPLHAAAEEDHPEVVKLLVKAGADISRLEVNGYSAGSRAGWREHWKIVRFLLQSGDKCQPQDVAGPWLFDKCTHLDLNASN